MTVAVLADSCRDDHLFVGRILAAPHPLEMSPCKHGVSSFAINQG